MASAIVDSISPASGPADGNTTVTITGEGFAEVTSVAFGPLAAPHFSVDSDSQITALSPPADFSGAATVRVTRQAGTSDPNPAAQFTYLTDVPAGNWNPPAGINRVKVWLNAFIPRDVPGKTETVPAGPHAGQTMLRGPIPSISDCYLTDQRTFNNDIHASSRMHSEVEINLAGPSIALEWHNCDHSIEVDCEDGDEECNKGASTSRMAFSNLRILSATTLAIDLKGAANNGCFTGAPDIDYHGTITIDLAQRMVSFEGLIDQFPAFEMYACADDGAGVPLFQMMPLRGKDPWNLPFDANRPQSSSVLI